MTKTSPSLEELARAMLDIATYAEHDDDCAASSEWVAKGNFPGDCTCGYTAASLRVLWLADQVSEAIAKADQYLSTREEGVGAMLCSKCGAVFVECDCSLVGGGPPSTSTPDQDKALLREVVEALWAAQHIDGIRMEMADALDDEVEPLRVQLRAIIAKMNAALTRAEAHLKESEG